MNTSVSAEPVALEPFDIGTQGPGAVFVASFSEFYSINHEPIARALAVTLGDLTLGQEAADEAMTRAYARWGTVSGYTNPAGWVYRVGLNWARSWLRRASRKMPWSGNDAAGWPEVIDTDLHRAIAKLDDKYRSVVVCRYLLDWSTDQTADALDLRAGTVKSRLSTALTQLRTHLGEAG